MREALQQLRGEGFVLFSPQSRRPRAADRRRLHPRHLRGHGAPRAVHDALVRRLRDRRGHRAAGGDPGRDRSDWVRRSRCLQRASTSAFTASSTTATTIATPSTCGGVTGRSCAPSARASRSAERAGRRSLQEHRELIACVKRQDAEGAARIDRAPRRRLRTPPDRADPRRRARAARAAASRAPVFGSASSAISSQDQLRR